MPRPESLWARVVTSISRCSTSIQDRTRPSVVHMAAISGVFPRRRSFRQRRGVGNGTGAHDENMRTRLRLLSIIAIGVFVGGTHAMTHTTAVPAVSAIPSQAPVRADWAWPVDGARHVVVPFRAPAHEYGAGHRGIDIGVRADGVIRAPAAGIVAFRGTVVDRPLITIEHAGGYVTTFEPVVSSLSPGDEVDAGTEIGSLSVGGHSAPGTLHVGVRLDGDYINPMLLFGGVPRAVLLPCCA